MTLTLPNTYILAGLALTWTVVFYFYWRYLRSMHLHSRFRAYDVLFFTLLLGLVVGRAIEVLSNLEYYLQIVGGLQFASFWDLQINYFSFVYIPLIAYQFESFNVERKLKWKEHARIFILFGVLLVLLVQLAQVGRGLNDAWPLTLVQYHGWLAGLLLVVALLIAFGAKLPRALTSAHILLIALATGIITTNLLIPALNTVELNATLVSQIVLCFISVVPFISRKTKKERALLRPNPADFRSL